MPKPPNRNLPTPAVPWGRWVEDHLSSLDSADTRQRQALGNAVKSINGTLGTLGDTVTRLAAGSTSGSGADSFNAAGNGSTTLSLTAPSWAKYAVVTGGVLAFSDTSTGTSQAVRLRATNNAFPAFPAGFDDTRTVASYIHGASTPYLTDSFVAPFYVGPGNTTIQVRAEGAGAGAWGGTIITNWFFTIQWIA